MLKTIIFQLHWLLGITAGTVLAVMGLSGATLAFEDEIMRAANPALAQVVQRHAAGEQPLALTELLPRLQQDMPQPLQRLRVDATGQRLSVARFEGGQANWRYFDPYTGTVLTGLKGLAFFAFVEDLHRHLVSGERGSLITGSCAIALVFFCLSGLYLRWPRRWWHWRTWLAVEWARSGRSFLWSLHSVVGTWVLLVYLIIALTGLWWSFDWYLTGATAWLGGPTVEQTAPRTRGGPLDLHKVQTTLYALEGVRRGYIDLRFPAKPGRALTSRVQGSNTAHDRAQDILQLDPSTGALLSYEPYRSKNVGGKIIVSVFALHSGSFFGLPGRIIVMLSSLGMLVFFITGWMLYLDRRRKKRDVRASRLPLATAVGTGQPWLVAFASQSGFAEQLAWRTAAQLQAAGLPVHVRPLSQVDAAVLADTETALFVISTFGDGEAPDAARAFERRVLAHAAALQGMRYAVLGLGDREYGRFCGFSRQVDGWLAAQGAQRLFASIEVDRTDAVPLAQWQQQLALLTGVEDHTPLPAPVALQPWALGARTVLNPGSAARAIWQVALHPPAHAHWQAGDILEMAPRHARAHVLAALARNGLDPQAPVTVDGRITTLLEAAAARVLPEAVEPRDPAAAADAALAGAAAGAAPSRVLDRLGTGRWGRAAGDPPDRAARRPPWAGLWLAVRACHRGGEHRGPGTSQHRLPSPSRACPDAADRQRHRYRRPAQPAARSGHTGRPRALAGVRRAHPRARFPLSRGDRGLAGEGPSEPRGPGVLARCRGWRLCAGSSARRTGGTARMGGSGWQHLCVRLAARHGRRRRCGAARGTGQRSGRCPAQRRTLPSRCVLSNARPLRGTSGADSAPSPPAWPG